METDNFTDSSLHNNQLKKYAQDLAEIYKSEKAKRKELQVSKEQLLIYADDLKKTIFDLKIAHKETQEAYLDTIFRLVLAAEYKDEDTGDHIKRMSLYSVLIAEKLGLSAKEVQDILYTAPMHDVGKVGVPDSILMKKGELTKAEFDIMKTHCTIGAKILSNPKSDILKIAEQIALTHHEKWNGKGYPQGLSRKKIPLVGRIVCLADTFDAITAKRPYKNPYPIEVAFEIIKKEREEQFDPDVADIFLKHIDEVVKIKEEVSSTEDVSLSNFTKSERDRLEGEVKGEQLFMKRMDRTRIDQRTNVLSIGQSDDDFKRVDAILKDMNLD